MIDIIYMVGIWQCHIPTPNHHVIFPPGGNMTGGNVLVSRCGHGDCNFTLKFLIRRQIQEEAMWRLRRRMPKLQKSQLELDFDEDIAFGCFWSDKGAPGSDSWQRTRGRLVHCNFQFLTLSYTWMDMVFLWWVRVRAAAHADETYGNRVQATWRLSWALKVQNSAGLLGLTPHLTPPVNNAGLLSWRH